MEPNEVVVALVKEAITGFSAIAHVGLPLRKYHVATTPATVVCAMFRIT